MKLHKIIIGDSFALLVIVTMLFVVISFLYKHPSLQPESTTLIPKEPTTMNIEKQDFPKQYFDIEHHFFFNIPDGFVVYPPTDGSGIIFVVKESAKPDTQNQETENSQEAIIISVHKTTPDFLALDWLHSELSGPDLSSASYTKRLITGQDGYVVDLNEQDKSDWIIFSDPTKTENIIVTTLHNPIKTKNYILTEINDSVNNEMHKAWESILNSFAFLYTTRQ